MVVLFKIIFTQKDKYLCLENLNTVIIDVSDKDFVNNPKDYKEIIDLIRKT